MRPEASSAAQGRDGFDTTVALDCGDTFRVNTDPRFMAFKVDDYASCSRHSAVRGYDPETGDPEYDRDRKIVEVRRDS